MDSKESPSQTAGPYVHIGCVPRTAGLEPRGFGDELGQKMVLSDAETITIEIIVLDGANDPVKDALIEIWQADPTGSYAPSASFRNWGRQACDLYTGFAKFETLKPGHNGSQAPHILVWIAARGINLGLTTRIYFPDEDNASDPVFLLAGPRASTLIATKTEAGYSHEVHLQGTDETVFFDV